MAVSPLRAGRGLDRPNPGHGKCLKLNDHKWHLEFTLGGEDLLWDDLKGVCKGSGAARLDWWDVILFAVRIVQDHRACAVHVSL